jgi:hypothetical protein
MRKSFNRQQLSDYDEGPDALKLSIDLEEEKVTQQAIVYAPVCLHWELFIYTCKSTFYET